MRTSLRPASLRVLIDAPNALDRFAIASLLANNPRLQVASGSQPASGRAASAEVHLTDVVVHAGTLPPGPASLDGGRRAPVLVVLREATAISTMLTLRAGAAGIACLDCHIDQLGSAVVTIAEGLGWLAPCMAKGIADHLSGRARVSDADAHGLTARELLVLRAMAAGEDNSAVAKRLGVDVRTVKFHSSNIYRKLGARHRAEAVALAYQLGLTS
jgi:DNA-binding NarL/FixJ family response regulator